MRKNPKIFLHHILESIEEIENHLRGISEQEFLKDTKTQDAVIRRIEIIGEAVKNLPSTFTKKYPEVEWREIAGMRDKLIHHYFGIDIEIVWEVVSRDIPKLKKQILGILEFLRSERRV